MVQDIRYAIRSLRKSPGFTVTSVAVLALAIGASTTMFSVLNAALFRPLPFRQPEQLAMLWTEVPSQSIREGRTAYWNIEQWKYQSKSFADVAFFDPVSVTLTGTDHAERVGAAAISPNLFSLLGIEPALGRVFTEEETARRSPVALISHRFWQSRFAGSVAAIGATIEIDAVPVRIIGILPAGFRLPQLETDVWKPHTTFGDWDKTRMARGSGSWFVLARLRPNVTLDQAQVEMNVIARRLSAQMPAPERNRGVTVERFQDQVAGPNARLALSLLMATVLCVLLIAATNVATLSLSRSAARQREFAIRAALGASRGRVVRQLLIESFLLAGASGGIGVWLAQMGTRMVTAFSPGGVVFLNPVEVDGRVLSVAVALCLTTSILVALGPVLVTRRIDPSGVRVSGGVAAGKLRRVLVVTQYAIAIVLLTGAGLLMRSLWSVERVALGFNPEHALTLQLAVPPSIPIARRVEFYDRVLEQIRALPSVESAGVIENLFIGGTPEQAIVAEGQTTAERLRVRSDGVSAGFFQAVGTSLIGGRFFNAQDASRAKVAIVNRALARRLWPGRDPIGLRFRIGAAPDGAWSTVVGIVTDMRRQGLESEPIPQVFEPLQQDPPRLGTLVVRTALDDPLRIAASVQAAVGRVDRHAPVYAVGTLESRLETYLASRKSQTSLVVCFSAAALLLAAIGIYGLVQYSVTARTHEIGIRIAVGAQNRDLFRLVLLEGLKLSLTGIAIGLCGALWMSRTASSLLFAISGTDAATFGAASALLTGVAAIACCLPAHRATKVDVVVALRKS